MADILLCIPSYLKEGWIPRIVMVRGWMRTNNPDKAKLLLVGSTWFLEVVVN